MKGAEPIYFDCDNEALAYLRKRDPALGVAIDRIGRIERPLNPDLFSALIDSIVGQQISTKAHATIRQRMFERFTPFTADTLTSVSAEELQACGITMTKALYIKSIVSTVQSGKLDLGTLHELPDEEVCHQLTQLRGVGLWTAEMLLTFSLARPNVISFGDLAIQRGLRMLYHHRHITPKLFAKYKRRYSPHATVASLYLWAIAGGSYPEYRDYAPKARASRDR